MAGNVKQIEVEDFTFKRTRTRTYDAMNDPNAALAALLQLVCPAGTIVPTLAREEPGPGWLLCNGQAVLKAEFPRLFALIGAAFGETATTFNLPDLRGRMPIGASESIDLLDTGGAESITLTVDQLPEHAHAIEDTGHSHNFTGAAHTHAVTDPGHSHAVTDPGHTHTSGTQGVQNAAGGSSRYQANTGNTGSATTGISVDSATTGLTIGDATATGTIDSGTTGITVLEAGGGEAIPTLPPYLAVNWMVRT